LGSTKLTDAVARVLFKLMAYKDEYEVARLHLDAVFRAKLSSEFEPGFKINYHLAPPAVPTGRDHCGRPRKIQFGSWMNGPFRALQSLKRLRGTRLDMFGLNHERKTERELISWYEGVVGQLCSHLTCDTVDNMAQIAAIPLDIRGFGPVKLAAVSEVRERVGSAVDCL
jgi:indolepyruvate ferredoxin oxidoreductase